MNDTINALLPITPNEIGLESVQTVSARSLHGYLGITRDFSTWVKDQIERADLEENLDYIQANSLLPIKGEQTSRGGSNKIEYYLTLDASKSIAMMSKSNNGKEVRKYFLECERVVKASAAEYNALTEIQQVERHLVVLKERAALQHTVNTHALFAISDPIRNGAEAISIGQIKAEIAPWLNRDKIRQILMYYDQAEVIGDTNIQVPSFQREGVEEAFFKFISECKDTTYISVSKKVLVITHKCLLGGKVQVKPIHAVKYFRRSLSEFKLN